MLGNVCRGKELGERVGLGNKDGKTISGEGQRRLGKVIKGAGITVLAAKKVQWSTIPLVAICMGHYFRKIQYLQTS